MQRYKVIIIGLLLVNCLPLTGLVNAAVINAASCSQADVLAAINRAVTGDTIIVPAGSGAATWSGNVAIPIGKKLSIIGPGRDSLTITGGAFTLGKSGSRISGFSFYNGIIYADGNGFVIENNRITFPVWTTGIFIAYRSVYPPVVSTGLISNNILERIRILCNGTDFMSAGSYPGNQSQFVLWSNSLGLGDNNAVYIENNTINNARSDPNAVDGNYGGRYVFRFNTVNNGTAIEAHSVQSTNRSIRRWEVYNNTFNNPGSSVYYAYRIRGGTGVVFNNTSTGNWTNTGVAFDIVRDYSASGFGLCDGTSVVDENISGQVGWHCLDQIGVGGDTSKWTTWKPTSSAQQTFTPAYLWNNTYAGNEISIDYINSNGNTHIQTNRDYYSKYGASCTAGGSCTTGVGTGTVLPTSCTTGVGFWKTDEGTWNHSGSGGQGVLYKCTATNTWKLYYTPYTYPHPLVSGGSSPTRIPNTVGYIKVQ